MPTNCHSHDVMRERLLLRAGLGDAPPLPSKKELKDKLAGLYQTEWSPRFEILMRNRLVMGALRYGLLAEKIKKGGKWNLIEPILKKVELYEKTGNQEYLVDAANYCLLAFECDNHPNRHFHALDDHHDHCKRRRKGDRRQNGHSPDFDKD